MSIAKKLKTVAENQQKVYDAGFTAGQATGGNTDVAYQAGFDAGKQAEYDAFWDEFQQNGKLTRYYSAFSGTGWNSKNLKPKYKITPEAGVYGCERMFFFCNAWNSQPIDFREIEEIFDFSNIAHINTMFADANINHITINLENVPDINNTFSSSFRYQGVNYLHLTLSENTKYTNAFKDNYKLTDIVIDGVIGNTINFQWSPLSKASIENVMSVLSDNTTGKTATFKKTAVNNAFTAEAWNALVATKPNWTITLA